MLRNAKTGFLRCIGYPSFIKDRIKLGSLQILALVQLQNFQKLLTSCLTAIKAKVIKYCETVYERSGKNMFWPIKNSGEVLSKLKDIGYQATSLSTYNFSTLYTTLPHNLIKEKLIDLIEWTLYKKEGKLYLACNDKKAFFTSADYYKGYHLWSCQMYVTPYRFSWTIFILGLALSYTDKLLVFRWVQIVLLL